MAAIETLVRRDAPCLIVLTQIAAVAAQLDTANERLLDTHTRECVLKVERGRAEAADDLLDVVFGYSRMN